jgi:hypothetical protein
MGGCGGTVIGVVAAVCCVSALHATAGVGADGGRALRVWNRPGSAIRAAADQASAAPGAGHGFLIDKHLAAGLACTACHTTTPMRPIPTATCLSCHGGSYDKLAAMSAADDPDSHQSHQGAVPCAACHHVHMASQNFCAQCHSEFNFKVP